MSRLLRALSRLITAVVVASLAACASAGGPGGGPEAGPGGGPPGQFAPGGVPIHAQVDVPTVPQLNGAHAAVKFGLAIYVSSQVAFDSTGAVVGAGDLRVQMEQAMRNVEQVVRAARGLPADVMKLTVYVVGSAANASAALPEVMGAVFPRSPQPAVTLVEVAGLPREDLLVAVDGIALLRSQFPDRERDRR